MSPLLLLIVVLALPLAALLLQKAERRERRAIEAMAREKELHFAADDRFKISSKVAELLPTPGAADVRVYDVIYGKDGTRYHFIFSVEWMEGSVRSKRRMQRVASFSEPKGDSSERSTMKLKVANDNAPRVDQYAALHAGCCAG